MLKQYKESTIFSIFNDGVYVRVLLDIWLELKAQNAIKASLIILPMAGDDGMSVVYLQGIEYDQDVFPPLILDS